MISFIIFIVYSIFTGIKNLVAGTSFWLWCKDVLKALILFVAAKGLFFAIHYLFGYQLLLARERELSDRFVNEKMAKIAKISGATGAGKDTFMRYVGTAKRNALIKKLKSRSKYIQKTVYWVSFDALNELIENDVKSVDDLSTEAIKMSIERLCGKMKSTTDGLKTVETKTTKDGVTTKTSNDCSGASNKVILVIPEDTGLKEKMEEIIKLSDTKGVSIELVQSYGNGASKTTNNNSQEEE